ncbi:hypothetical protein CSKR_109559 [Clonorchis sinensis]|uniref:Uncharacterized protein n=1 Tax=Clonorchis sinensis TaxID=79923 RepID=A0A3R7JN77_CLOSI|nr:hypothetical protein CSKR_109559 [Clonorchis sinensis]
MRRLKHEAAWCSTFSCLKTSQTGDPAGFEFTKSVYHSSRNTLICKSSWFCEGLTSKPAGSPVCDVFRQLNVLHQAASCLPLCFTYKFTVIRPWTLLMSNSLPTYCDQGS